MFARKPRTEIVYRILLITAIFLSAPLNSFSVHAADPTQTATAEPTNTGTPTVQPTITPVETSTPAT